MKILFLGHQCEAWVHVDNFSDECDECMLLLGVNMLMKYKGKRLFVTFCMKLAVCNILVLNTVKIPNFTKIGTACIFQSCMIKVSW